MTDDINKDEPPKPTGRPPKPGKPPLFKDRRAHRIELRNKISGFKEEINELKSVKSGDESKNAEIQKKISVLMTRLKECEMEKESIEQFNHTQFVKNVEKSREDESRFDKESHGQTWFFKNLTKNEESNGTTLDSVWNSSEDENTESPSLNSEVTGKKEEGAEVSSSESETESTDSPAYAEKPKEAETEAPLPQIELPPNTIV